MANSAIYKSFVSALERWPQDLLRPEVSFRNVMRKRLDKRFAISSGAPNGGSSVTASTPVNEIVEKEQVKALESLLQDRYKAKYPLSDNFMRPASNPTHYTNLIAELDAAPTRSWLGAQLNKWKGFLRFS
ncbi:MAG: hypothetical protein M1833_005060 [Piccolia ochrophora]|nr:MAG: hypothetical protein M1833_005060 [Piccolia ochrophora]